MSARWRYLVLLAIVALPLLGWLGTLDRYSAEQVDHSIATAGVIYGTARGINALVSLLQGTELNIPFLTFTIGEVLDPVNDLIERFSEVILIALGSLALQKILLAVVSDTLFNIALSIAAAATALALLPGRTNLLSQVLRGFLLIAFLRFSLGLVVLANGWVDATFLDAADQRRHRAMEKFQGELREIDSLSRTQARAQAGLEDAAQEQRSLQAQLDQLQQEIAQLDVTVDAAKSELAARQAAAGGLCRLSALAPTCPEDVAHARSALAVQQRERQALRDRAQALRDSLATLDDTVACLEKRGRGESCGLWDSLPSPPDAEQMRQKLNEINDDLSDFAENSINLLVSLLLKTVAIPLLFIYLVYRVVSSMWNRL
ncbi:MAG: hypothetical protein CME59_05155 [Halioglobus sp.]|nr:hypothetical protein [Halioglobus sp.]|tara:strand:- start:6628 stop:7749 length:1122 start_codon:yes stop_codon:yes gene_type:complete